jgi:uncharacterized FAD-dependent dehydrogenase
MKILLLPEKGAGTYSDGKLYTRSKRGDVTHSGIISGLWCYPDILVEAHPHIGTNKLPKLFRIFARKLSNGGQVLFETRVTDIVVK